MAPTSTMDLRSFVLLKNKMKRICTLFILILSVCFSAYAQTQQGIVKTRGRINADGELLKGLPISGATITVRNGGSYISGNNGAFTFIVPSHSYYLSEVQKNEYELCDRDLLDKSYKLSSNPLVIVMDKPDNTLEDRLRAEVHIREILIAQLNKHKAELKELKEQQKISNQEYKNQIQELLASQKNNEKLIAEMAERYSTIDFDQKNNFQRQVAFFIQRGELTRADSLLNTKGSMEERSAELDRMDVLIKYDEDDIAKRQENHEKSVALKAKKLEEFADDCYSKFEVCKLLHRNDSAAYWLKLRASKDTMNVNWLLETGSFIEKYLSDYDLSMQYYQQSLSNAKKSSGENSEYVAKCFVKIGGIYKSKGIYEKAIEFYQKAVGIYQSIFDNIYPQIADIYRMIEDAYFLMGEYQVAAVYDQKATKTRIASFDVNENDSAVVYSNMGYVYKASYKYDIALEYYKKALTMFLEKYGTNNYNIADTYNHIAEIYNFIGEYEKALDYYHKFLLVQKTLLGENHIDLANSYEKIGNIYCNLGNYEQGLEFEKKRLSVYLTNFGKNHSYVARSYFEIGFICSLRNENCLALRYYQKALKVMLTIFGENHPDIADLYDNFAVVYNTQNNFECGLEYYKKSLSVKQIIYGEESIAVASGYEDIARSYSYIGDRFQQLEYLQRALKIRIELNGEEDSMVSVDYGNIGDVYFDMGDYTYALDFYNKSLRANNDENSAYSSVINQSIVDVYKSALINNDIMLDGFYEMFIYTMTTDGDETPAQSQGMEGEYYILAFGDWNIEMKNSLFNKNKEMRGKPKTILVMKDGIITEHYFENNIGVRISIKNVGLEKKQCIINAYQNWIRNIK